MDDAVIILQFSDQNYCSSFYFTSLSPSISSSAGQTWSIKLSTNMELCYEVWVLLIMSTLDMKYTMGNMFIPIKHEAELIEFEWNKFDSGNITTVRELLSEIKIE